MSSSVRQDVKLMAIAFLFALAKAPRVGECGVEWRAFFRGRRPAAEEVTPVARVVEVVGCAISRESLP